MRKHGESPYRLYVVSLRRASVSATTSARSSGTSYATRQGPTLMRHVRSSPRSLRAPAGRGSSAEMPILV